MVVKGISVAEAVKMIGFCGDAVTDVAMVWRSCGEGRLCKGRKVVRVM